MRKTDYGLRERIRFGAENTPLYHRFKIEAGYLLLFAVAYLRGSLVISGGTASGASVGENPGGFVQTFDIDAVADGKYAGGRLKHLTARSCVRRHIFDKGTLEFDQSLGSGGVSGAAGTFVLNSPFRLPFALPGLAKPVETALDLAEYADVTLQITNGSRARQFGAANDRTFNYDSVVWDIVDAREWGNGYKPAATLFDVDFPVTISAANARFALNSQLPKDGAYLDILYIAETTSEALSDAIINRVTTFRGTEQFQDQYEDHIKGENLEYRSDVAASMTGLYYTPFAVSAGDGKTLLSGAVDDVNAVLDISNPGTDRLIVNPRRVIAPRG